MFRSFKNGYGSHKAQNAGNTLNQKFPIEIEVEKWFVLKHSLPICLTVHSLWPQTQSKSDTEAVFQLMKYTSDWPLVKTPAGNNQNHQRKAEQEVQLKRRDKQKYNYSWLSHTEEFNYK